MATVKCNKCNGVMIQRVNHSNGVKFWGCSNYPACKGGRPVFEKESIEIKPVESMDKITLSDEQELIKQFALNESGSMIVNAYPGTGKTFTLQHGIYPNLTGSRIILAYNVKIAREIQSRGLNGSTLDSYTRKQALKIYPSAKIDTDKNRTIISTCGLLSEDEVKSLTGVISGIIDILYSNCIFNPTLAELESLALVYHSQFTVDINRRLLDVINYVISEKVRTCARLMDFKDTARVCIEHSESIEKYNNIMVDEAQDLSKLYNAVIMSALESNGRLFFVGDKFQAINGWNGADYKSLDTIRERYNVTDFKLTYTRRLPQIHLTNYINSHFPEIDIKSEKEGGEFATIEESNLIESLVNDKSATVICRNNAPLIKPAFDLIKLGYTCQIVGKGLDVELISLVMLGKKISQSSNLIEVLSGIDSYVSKKFKQFENAKNKNWLNELADQQDTINAIAKETESTEDLILKISYLFNDRSKTDYTFITGHKSKGLEWNNVYLIKLDLIGKKAITSEEMEQESNIHFVMCTRSLNKLVIVE